MNAFGFAGINAHAVLEESASSDGTVPGALLRWPDEAILIAARDRDGLLARVDRLATRLRSRPDLDLKDLAASLNAEATSAAAPCRLGLVARSVEGLIGQLESVCRRLSERERSSIRDAKGAYYWDRPPGLDGGLAFLFPGEGSQYPGMLADLCMHFPEVRRSFDQIERMAGDSGAISSPSDLLFGPGAGDDPSLWETSTAVHVVLGSQWALFQLLRRLGLRPDALCGHSSGEFPALVAAGAIAEDEGLEGRFNELAILFADLERSGAIPEAKMLGVAADRGRVEALAGDLGGRLSVAVDNCPHQVVLVGTPAAIEDAARRVRAAGIGCEELPFVRAYHSPEFSPAMGPIRAFFESIPMRPPAVPVYSCCLAGRFPGDVEGVRHAAIAQWTRPVEFRETVEAMFTDGVRVFLDVGGRGNLSAFVEDTLRGRPAFSVAANLPRRSGLSQLNHLVASLFAQGVPIDPAILYARRRPSPVDLDQAPEPARTLVPLRLGFPEMRLPESLAAELGSRMADRPPESAGLEFEEPGGHFPFEFDVPSPPHEVPNSASLPSAHPVMSSYFGTMQAFLETQRQAYANYFASRRTADGVHRVGDRPGPIGGVTDVPRVEPPDSFGSIHRPGGPRFGPETSVVSGDAGVGRRVTVRRTLDAAGDPVAEHHTFGGRRVSAVDPGLKGLPVLPFTIMAEMLAEVASTLAPGMRLVGLRDVRARRWVRYEDVPIGVEIRAEADPDRPGSIHAALFNRGPEDRPTPEDAGPEVEAVVDFAPARPAPAEPMPFDLGPNAAPTRFTASSIYAEQWLFHGPALRAVAGIGEASPEGIEGTLRVLPRRALLRDPESPPPLTDPIVLDAFTHLLGCWGLDQLSEGDVIFPLRLGRLEIFGDDPPEGSEVACRIAVKEVDRLRVRVDAEILRPDDGRTWMRLTDWEDWRFYWPPRYRDVFRQPDRELLGEPMALPGLGPDAVAVWLRPPPDMGRPVWRDVLEQIQLSPQERAGCLRPAGPEERRTLRLWGRIAAKEAARRLLLLGGEAPMYPADLSIEPDPFGRPIARSRLEPDRLDLPAVSIAHTEGVAVALASRSPGASVGIDVERIVPRSASFEGLAFTEGERSWLARLANDDDRPDWIARFWCAKEAAGKATGRGMVAGPPSVEVVEADPTTGLLRLRLGPDLAGARPDLASAPLEAGTAVREGYAYAWVAMEAERR